MELQDKIELVNSLIKENPDCNIREYLDTVAEIEAIETN